MRRVVREEVADLGDHVHLHALGEVARPDARRGAERVLDRLRHDLVEAVVRDRLREPVALAVRLGRDAPLPARGRVGAVARGELRDEVRGEAREAAEQVVVRRHRAAVPGAVGRAFLLGYTPTAHTGCGAMSALWAGGTKKQHESRSTYEPDAPDVLRTNGQGTLPQTTSGASPLNTILGRGGRWGAPRT